MWSIPLFFPPWRPSNRRFQDDILTNPGRDVDFFSTSRPIKNQNPIPTVFVQLRPVLETVTLPLRR